MEPSQKKRGQNAKVQRTWLSEEGYRVHWRREAYGVAMTPAYMACVVAPSSPT